MKKLFILLTLLLFVGCNSATTYYTKKTTTTETVKEINCHEYRRRSVIKQTQIIEVEDEVIPYGDREFRYLNEVQEETGNYSISQ